MKCPKCSRRLRVDAEACLCGWSRNGTSVGHRDCAHAPACTRDGNIREATATGWAHFCEYHYVDYHHRKSVERCKELGLESVEDMKAFCRQKLKTVLKPMPMAREPGQDDEENEVRF